MSNYPLKAREEDASCSGPRGSRLFDVTQRIAHLSGEHDSLLRMLFRQLLLPEHRRRSGLDRALCLAGRILSQQVRRVVIQDNGKPLPMLIKYEHFMAM